MSFWINSIALAIILKTILACIQKLLPKNNSTDVLICFIGNLAVNEIFTRTEKQTILQANRVFKKLQYLNDLIVDEAFRLTNW